MGARTIHGRRMRPEPRLAGCRSCLTKTNRLLVADILRGVPSTYSNRVGCFKEANESAIVQDDVASGDNESVNIESPTGFHCLQEM